MIHPLRAQFARYALLPLCLLSSALALGQPVGREHFITQFAETAMGSAVTATARPH